MTLSQEQFQTLSCIETPEVLSLQETNVSDGDLAGLEALKNLKHFRLSKTGVTDKGFKYGEKLKSLRSICLSKVRITPAAVAQLNHEFKQQGCKLGIGYSRIQE